MGSDINSRDNNGMTPLHWPCRCGYLKIVHLLITHGADINIADNEGNIPLDLANVINQPKISDMIEEFLVETYNNKNLKKIAS